MARASEEISKYTSNSGGKTDSNLANDSLHLGGIAADEYATKKYVQEYVERIRLALKEYLDTQDLSMLQQAKAYTDLMINSQDFSNFAKLTDLQALNVNLTNIINTGLTNQQNYTDTQIEAVVSDVNANFDDVGQSITNLNNITQQLFQSVSSGKSKIAGAITDKGVSTSASDTFDTMATNIRNIQTGGGGGGDYDENFVNTGDATATANDILLGKTAYAKGQKIYGTLIAQPEEGYPTYGTDTSGATATEADIAYGKTAYARGQLLVGTMENDDVEEIHGISADNLNYHLLNNMEKDPLTNEKISTIKKGFSKDLKYCVRATYLNNDSNTKYIESYPIGENGLYVCATTNMQEQTTYKKYRYTFEELGLDNSWRVQSIGFSAGGVHSDPKKCYLYIVISYSTTDTETSNNITHYKLYVYTYHLRENGVIGREYERESILELNDEFYSYTPGDHFIWSGCDIITSNLTTNRFFLFFTPAYLGGSSVDFFPGKIYNNILVFEDRQQMSGVEHEGASGTDLIMTPDDQYIYNQYLYSRKKVVVKIDPEHNYQVKFKKIETAQNSRTYNAQNKYFVEANVSSTGTISIVSYDDYGNKTTHKTVSFSDITNLYIEAIFEYGDLLIVFYINNQTLKLKTYKVNLYSLPDGAEITADSTLDLNLTTSSSYVTTAFYINYDYDYNTFVCSLSYEELTQFRRIDFIVDTNNIVGIRYKNKLFYNTNSLQLSAGQPDVKTGKTFIGYNGIPETGTMEVE